MGKFVELGAGTAQLRGIMSPGASVLVVNDDAFASLTEEQQATFHQAAIDAMDEMVHATRIVEDEAFATLCDAGLPMVLASDEQLAGIRETLQPAYDEIAGHGDNAEVLARIEELKADLAVPPDGPTCDGEPATTDAGGSNDGTAEFPQGTFETTVTARTSSSAAATPDSTRLIWT